MPFDPISQDEFRALPPEKQLAYLRTVDALQPRRIAARPLNPPPSTIDALRTECVAHRRRIVEAMQQGQQFHPGTDANFIGLLKGEKTGFFLPPLDRLWHAATVLGVKTAPPFPGEPQTALEAVAALDGLLVAISGTAPPSTDEGTKKKPKGRGGKPRLELSNPHKANLYTLIRNARRPGESYNDLAQRLRQDKDTVDLARVAGVPRITPTIIRCAIAHQDQRQRDARKKQETDPA